MNLTTTKGSLEKTRHPEVASGGGQNPRRFWLRLIEYDPATDKCERFLRKHLLAVILVMGISAIGIQLFLIHIASKL